MTSYIYFIQARGDGPIKVGITQYNPRRRMVKLQTDCPWPVRLLGAIEGSRAQERQIHLLLARFRTQGEWFGPHPIVLAAVREALLCGNAAPQVIEKPRVARHSHPLSEYRARNGLTLEDLSKATDISVSRLSRIETGRHKPNRNAIAALMKATGLSVMQIRPDLAELARTNAA